MLYSILNPVTAVTVGKVNAEAHVLAGAVKLGAVGNITTLTVLLAPHAPVPVVPAVVLPQSAVSTYLVIIVWQPGVVGTVGEDVKPPPSILY